MPHPDGPPVRPVSLMTSDGVHLGTDHAATLRRVARYGDPWTEPGMGHGATGPSPALAHRIGDWTRHTTGARTGEQDGEAA